MSRRKVNPRPPPPFDPRCYRVPSVGDDVITVYFRVRSITRQLGRPFASVVAAWLNANGSLSIADTMIDFGDPSDYRPVPLYRVPPPIVVGLVRNGKGLPVSQPLWKCVANLGDVNWLEHGGLFVYEDLTGVYEPEMERVEERVEVVDDDLRCTRWEVHRVGVDRCYYENGILSDNKFHKDLPAWFANAVQSPSVADIGNLPATLCSNDSVKRARAYAELADHFGWHEFDDNPLTFTHEDEVRARYAKNNAEPYYGGLRWAPSACGHKWHEDAIVIMPGKCEKCRAFYAWNDGTVPKVATDVARALRLRGDAAGLPILADALEEAGCTEQEILTHLRAGRRHYEDCWVTRMLLHNRKSG